MKRILSFLCLLCLFDIQTFAEEYPSAKKIEDYCKLAEQGDAVAQFHLGECYADGNGVTKDVVKAYMWFKLAIVAGNKSAEENLRKVAKEMTPEQIAEAQQMSREWKLKKEATRH